MDLSVQAETPAKRKRPGRKARRLLPVAGASLLLAALVAGLWPQAVPVETGQVELGPLQATVNEEGRTRIRHRFTVSVPVSGHLRRIELKAGDPVEVGQVVAIIDPLTPALLDPRARALAEARRDSAAANLEKARAALAFAENEVRRFDRLHREGTISDQELDVVRLREESARKDTAAAESALRQAQAELAEFSGVAAGRKAVDVQAPVRGKVLRVLEESSRVVLPGTPLLELGDPSDLEVVIDVLSRDGAIIRPGMLVYLDQWGGAEPLEARVRLVEPAAFTKVSALGVEEQRVNVMADLVTPPEERPTVGDNFRVESRIVTWEDPRSLKAPAGALFRDGEHWSVFVFAAGKAEQRRIKAGRTSGSETQILEGLRPGERVILYPGSRVRPGGRVRQIQIED